MKAGVTKSCSRCKKEIQCRIDAIEKCACSQVELTEDCIAFLKKTNYDCLCNTCLIEINVLVLQADSMPSKVVEDLHYYMENGLLVFTELNHIQRGYCCESNCRHCAYGFKVQM